MITQTLSWVLCVWGCIGLWLAGKGRRSGWWVGLASEPLWIWLAVITHAYGLIPGALLYAAVYARNIRRKP